MSILLAQHGIISRSDFLPTDIPSLLTWIDGSDPGVVANRWDDKSGNGNHWSTTIASEFPTHVPADNSMYFDGGDVITAGAFLVGQPAAEVMIKVKMDGLIGNAIGQALWYMSDKDDDGDWYYYPSRQYLGWGCTVRHDWAITSTEINNVYAILNITSRVGEWRARLNGTTRFSTASNTVTFIAAPQIGRMGGGNYLFKGWIKEMCIFSEELSTANRIAMRTRMDAL